MLDARALPPRQPGKCYIVLASFTCYHHCSHYLRGCRFVPPTYSYYQQHATIETGIASISQDYAYALLSVFMIAYGHGSNCTNNGIAKGLVGAKCTWSAACIWKEQGRTTRGSRKRSTFRVQTETKRPLVGGSSFDLASLTPTPFRTLTLNPSLSYPCSV